MSETELWPEPVPGAPYTSRSLAQLALGVAARVASDFARSMVPTGRRRAAYDGVLLADALSLCAHAERILEAAVVVERADGTAWEEIADSLGVTPSTAQERWQPAAQRWQDQVEIASMPGHAADDLPGVLADRPGHLAHQLDEWVLRHRELIDPIDGEHPVTDVLEPMNPLLELLHLRGQLQRLRDSDVEPSPGVLSSLIEREAIVQAALDKADDKIT